MSDEKYLRFFESYKRQPLDEINNMPKQAGDFRERVKRETVRGRYGVFHETIEMYFYRHWRAFTCPRVALFWFGTIGLWQHSLQQFTKTFPNLLSYPSFSAHPNYKKLGGVYSWFYALRPMFWTYMAFRMTRFLGYMILRHWEGKDDPHYFMYYDTLYPDLLHDEEDMRYINFRYSDQKVVPDDLTGYYPYSNMRYGNFLGKKEDIRYVDKGSAPAI